MLEFYPSAPGSTMHPGDPGQTLLPTPPMPFPPPMNNNNLEPSISVKTEAGLLEAICAACGRGIADRYVMRVGEKSYHEDCLSCAACASPLANTCFTKDHKLYCRVDYERIFGVKCGRCLVKIRCSDLVMRVAGLIFHVECFICCMCGQSLPRGAHFVLRQGQPICRRDYEQELLLNSPQDNDLVDENRPRDGRRGPKRPRTILSSVQRRQFKASFELSPKPCRKRAKMKKQQRKAKADPGTEKEPKEERAGESPHSDHSHYLNALSMRDGDSSSFPSATQPLNPNNPYSPGDAYPGHSGESFCSSDLSLDGTDAGFDMGEGENGGHDGSHPGGPHSHHGPPPHETPTLSQSLHAAMHNQHNPIDKLFMMQTNYFSGEHA